MPGRVSWLRCLRPRSIRNQAQHSHYCTRTHSYSSGNRVTACLPGGSDFQGSTARLGRLTRGRQQAIHRLVVVLGLVMKQHELLRAGILRQGHRFFIRRMPPAAVLLQLLRRVQWRRESGDRPFQKRHEMVASSPGTVVLPPGASSLSVTYAMLGHSALLPGVTEGQCRPGCAAQSREPPDSLSRAETWSTCLPVSDVRASAGGDSASCPSPGTTFGLPVDAGKSAEWPSMAYVPDNEAGPGAVRRPGELGRDFVAFLKGVDHSYPRRHVHAARAWSSTAAGAFGRIRSVTPGAGCRREAARVFHHEPEHDDEAMDGLLGGRA